MVGSARHIPPLKNLVKVPGRHYFLTLILVIRYMIVNYGVSGFESHPAYCICRYGVMVSQRLALIKILYTFYVTENKN